MEGWIKLHRSIMKWEWYGDINTKGLFLHLLLLASYGGGKWQGQTIKRGQLITGRRRLAKDLGLSEQQIRTSLSRLKSTNDITIESTSKNSMITIHDYSTYNDQDSVSNQLNPRQSTNDQPTVNHIKEGKEIKKEYKDNNMPLNSGKKKRQKLLPVFVTPPSYKDTLDYCNAQRFSSDYIDPLGLWNFYVTDKEEGTQWMYKDGKPVMNWKSLYRNIHNSNLKQGKIVTTTLNKTETTGNFRLHTALQDGTRATPAHLVPRTPTVKDDPVNRNEHMTRVEEVCFDKDGIVYARRGDNWFDSTEDVIPKSHYADDTDERYDCIKQAITKA